MSQAPSLDLDNAFARLPQSKVAVIGDVMLDRFVHGRVERISPEAPVPVVQVSDQEERLGGAANVAANAAALGAQVSLFGMVGPGEAGQALRSALGRAAVVDGLVEIEGRRTTVKTRILGGGQQIARIDRESPAPLTDAERGKLHGAWGDLGDYDVVIVSDYAKGVVEERLMQALQERCRAGGLVVVDPKQGNFELYRGCTCITPNAKEAGEASHSRVEDDASAEQVGRGLLDRLSLEYLLLTRGEQGMTVVAHDAVHHLPTISTEVFDVTGAGDTVIAAFALLLAAGAAPVHAASVANHAAGLVIRELGTAVIDVEALRSRCSESTERSR